MPRGKIAPSVLSADFGRLADEIRAVEAAGADWIHLDVMDGHFVPNLTIGPMVVEAARKVTELPLDVHLMIEQPEKYVGDFARAGASYISVHQETCPHLHAVLQQIDAAGATPGLVLNPATPLSTIEIALADVGLLLIMSVNPGFGGQQFIPKASLAKIRTAAEAPAAAARGLDFLDRSRRRSQGLATSAPGFAAAGADMLRESAPESSVPANYAATIAAMRRELDLGLAED